MTLQEIERNKERSKLKTAKAQYKASKKNKLVFNETRDAMIRLFLGAKMPNFGSIKFTVTKLGV
jgi:hypothetical protein